MCVKFILYSEGGVTLSYRLSERQRPLDARQNDYGKNFSRRKSTAVVVGKTELVRNLCCFIQATGKEKRKWLLRLRI